MRICINKYDILVAHKSYSKRFYCAELMRILNTVINKELQVLDEKNCQSSRGKGAKALNEDLIILTFIEGDKRKARFIILI